MEIRKTNSDEIIDYEDPYRELQELVLLEPDTEWIKKEEKKLKSIKSPDVKSFEFYVRNQSFTKKIRLIYKNRCAISGHRVETPFSLIDACHIIPFSKSFNNSFRNGIALTPTLHRAFDRGMISIDKNYEVVVNKTLKEQINSPYNISQFEGKSIIKNLDEKFLPSLAYLKEHSIIHNFK